MTKSARKSIKAELAKQGILSPDEKFLRYWKKRCNASAHFKSQKPKFKISKRQLRLTQK